MYLPQISGGFFLFVSVAYAAIGPIADLFIGNAIIQPDGFSRSAVLSGSTLDSLEFPGPLIQAYKGDKFYLNVINELTDPMMDTSTSIHWHGLYQNGSSWADGSVGVTQCPITPGNSFLYQFKVPNQAGTFWYHSHLPTQYCDGLGGALVVYDPEDPYKDMYDFDDESTVITLGDWYHVLSPRLPPAPLPQSTLVNGLGRSLGGPTSPLAIISVLQHRRYRFRLVSMSCKPGFVFSIDGHDMTIIEVDGINVKPLLVDSIQIFAGQRYSFILTANQPFSNYWIRANPDEGNKGFNGGINSAILEYVHTPIFNINRTTPDPTTPEVASINPMLETNLHPLSNPGAPGVHIPGAADINLNLLITLNRSIHQFSINNASFVPPTTPVLLQILSGAQTAQDLLPSASIYSLPLNKVIEISIPGGTPGGAHPFHLHGQTFDVIRSAGSSVYNFEDPVRRDVVNTGVAGDNTTIRFSTHNSGPWFLHCHVDFHLFQGLAIVFAEDIPTIGNTNPPDAWDKLCKT